MCIACKQPLDDSSANPVQLMSDTHRRCMQTLSALIDLASLARGGELWPEQKGRLEALLLAFRIALRLHVADEEASLFPRLRANVTDDRVRRSMNVMAIQEDEHRTMQVAHRIVDTLGFNWLFEGHLPESDVARLLDLLHRLRDMLSRHCDILGIDLAPLAMSVLPRVELQAMLCEIAERHAACRCGSNASPPGRTSRTPTVLGTPWKNADAISPQTAR